MSVSRKAKILTFKSFVCSRLKKNNLNPQFKVLGYTWSAVFI